ncbi:hypothetical protein [Nonomuraea roseoviolacea]|uniref:Uncharacterized protein n=1 Tax=Nonomuraea roseoviolacea subsp. carminata TaxID=160689 RepID=A0ABT1KG39_9ACTN|nr:hypothetical protein [Nonomuraea roseoviolacea]MCP2352341.1 hypothetical protein [Nonomuraea roseoviolacea subsp. carminata]
MSLLTSLARLRALDERIAQPIATVRHCHLSERPMVLIPLRMSGEAAAPLAAMLGTRREDPRLLVVTQPRNRDLRFAWAADLAAELLPYIDGFLAGTETVERKNADPYERVLDAPQLLVPNQTGIAFIRLLGRSTRFRRADGPYPVPETVPLLGRWLTYFGERAAYPGSSLMAAATEELGRHWASGQSGLEDANLAALMAWITTGPSDDAEDPLVWPPAGPATDPGFDAEVLAPAIEAGAAERITEALRGQLEPTWRLMWQAVDLLRGLPEGASVAQRWEQDRGSFSAMAAHIAEGAPPQARRDGAVAAASRLARMERAQAAYEVQRAYDDPLVMAEYRLTGEAFAGEVVETEPEHSEGEGRSRKLRPLVVVKTDDPVRLAPGTALGTPQRRGQGAQLVEARDGLVTVKITKGMGRGKTPAPGSVPEVGERVCYTSLTDDFQGSPALPEAEATPWTHGGPPREYTPSDEDALEEWS